MIKYLLKNQSKKKDLSKFESNTFYEGCYSAPELDSKLSNLSQSSSLGKS